jgi:hypothetical protein
MIYFAYSHKRELVTSVNAFIFMFDVAEAGWLKPLIVRLAPLTQSRFAYWVRERNTYEGARFLLDLRGFY